MGVSGGVAVDTEVAALLATVGLSPDLAGQNLTRLSTSRQYRVAVAATLAARPRLILADEPGASLDDAGEEGLARLFVKKCEKGSAALVIFTSRESRAGLFANRVIHLE